MKRTDILTGRIVQRVLDERTKNNSKITIIHGVDNQCNIERLINNLFELYPSSQITLSKLNFGYELVFCPYYKKDTYPRF